MAMISGHRGHHAPRPAATTVYATCSICVVSETARRRTWRSQISAVSAIQTGEHRTRHTGTYPGGEYKHMPCAKRAPCARESINPSTMQSTHHVGPRVVLDSGVAFVPTSSRQQLYLQPLYLLLGSPGDAGLTCHRGFVYVQRATHQRRHQQL